MKKVLTVALLMLGLSVSGQDNLSYGFSVGPTKVGTTNYAIVPAYGRGAPIITLLAANATVGTKHLQFYKTGTSAIVNTTTSSSTNVPCTPVGITNGTVCILRKVATDTYERLSVTSAASTNLGLAAATSITAGDIVYLATTTGKIPFASSSITTNLVLTGYVQVGERNKPLLVEVNDDDGEGKLLVNGRFSDVQ